MLPGLPETYTATAGALHTKNDDGDPVALFGFTAYTLNGADAGTRPIMFAYNGGPGSATAWLRLGVPGPKHTSLKDLESMPRFAQMSRHSSTRTAIDAAIFRCRTTRKSGPVIRRC